MVQSLKSAWPGVGYMVISEEVLETFFFLISEPRDSDSFWIEVFSEDALCLKVLCLLGWYQWDDAVLFSRPE